MLINPEPKTSLDWLNDYLAENGVEVRRAFDRDAWILTLPDGFEILIDGISIAQAWSIPQLVLDTLEPYLV